MSYDHKRKGTRKGSMMVERRRVRREVSAIKRGF